MEARDTETALSAMRSRVWAPAPSLLLSRAISDMDESGFPEAVAPWFPDEEPAG